MKTGAKEIDLRADLIKRFIDAKDEKEICHILKEYSNQFFDYQTFSLSLENESAKEFEVHVSRDKDFKDYFVLKSTKKDINLTALKGGETYYYKVFKDNVFSKVIKEGTIRTKNVPGIFYNIEGMCNIRDIGGWKALDGKKIKHGLIIRGIRTNDYDNVPTPTEEGRRILTDVLKIRGEIDLRADNDRFNQTRNFLDEDKPYLVAPITTCCYILPFFNEGGPNNRCFEQITPSSMNKIFKFLLEKDNYPIFVHCNSGADRTGTLCALIEGLLGVPEEDLYKDFELTSFSPATRRWRSSIKEDFTFGESGVMQDDEYNYVAIKKCLRSLKKHYGPDKTLQTAIENYFKEVCDIKDEEIKQLKEMLLE